MDWFIHGYKWPQHIHIWSADISSSFLCWDTYMMCLCLFNAGTHTHTRCAMLVWCRMVSRFGWQVLQRLTHNTHRIYKHMTMHSFLLFFSFHRVGGRRRKACRHPERTVPLDSDLDSDLDAGKLLSLRRPPPVDGPGIALPQQLGG